MSNGKNKKEKVKIFTKRKKHNKPESEFINELQEKYGEELDLSNIKSFSDFPLSPKTLKGLKSSGYNKPTDIQKETLMLALNGKDILGAAQTGSGKTLAFLIPILEKLFCKQWTQLDGLGALVITPTRELAYQIFETLRKVGAQHDFSAGLIIGGKDLKFERTRMHQCNIVICTPGRLLQHMDENPLFDAVNLQILVLDEADRCLDMGFKETMNAIIANLPPKRQTLLFSATQTKSVKDLARLSLKDPSYIAVHENAKYSTPLGLQQSYVECELKDKVSMIWSFIKNHLKKKCIIFVSTCKQAKYMCEIFSKLRPGTSLMALYGTLHQLRRMNIYESFARKSSAVLFATDLAARGLDFPEVHWVVQMDCPEDADTYIHRVGRTARYYKGGESLLLLMPSELQMLEELAAKRIPIEKIEINPLKLNNPVKKMKTFLTTNTALKESARRAFMNYAKAIAHMKNKKIFNVDALDTDSFSESLGLTVPPRIRFLERMNKKKMDETKPEKPNPRKTYFENDTEFSADQNEPTVDHFSIKSEEMDSSDREDNDTKNLRLSADESGDELSLFYGDNEKEHVLKSRPKDLNLNEISYERGNPISKKAKTKAKIVRQILKKNIVPNKKIVFDENGEQVIQTNKESKSQLAVEYDNEENDIDIEKLKAVLAEQDKLDRERDRERVKSKHREVKRKLKERKRKEKEEEEGEKDDFGEDESEDEPDLSWLPDPDKVYGKKDEDEVSDSDFNRSNIDETDNADLEVDTKVLKKKKRGKRKTTESNKEVHKKKRKLEQIKELTTKLTVNEAEELALVLLGK